MSEIKRLLTEESVIKAVREASRLILPPSVKIERRLDAEEFAYRNMAERNGITFPDDWLFIFGTGWQHVPPPSVAHRIVFSTEVPEEALLVVDKTMFDSGIRLEDGSGQMFIFDKRS